MSGKRTWEGAVMSRRLLSLILLGVVPMVVGAFALAAPPARQISIAGTLEPPRSLDDVARGSSVIAIVRPTQNAEVHWNNASNTEWSTDAVIYTDREFIVDSVLKGTDPTPLRVRLPGGDDRGVTMMFEELPEITPGRRYIMFLTQRETPTQEGSEVAWTITRYEGVFEEGAGGNWRNQTYARETTVRALQRLMQ